MNVVDSSGWLEYFADGANADFFAPPIQKVTELVVPTISLYEVFRRVHQQRGEDSALHAVATMLQGSVADLIPRWHWMRPGSHWTRVCLWLTALFSRLRGRTAPPSGRSTQTSGAWKEFATSRSGNQGCPFCMITLKDGAKAAAPEMRVQTHEA